MRACDTPWSRSLWSISLGVGIESTPAVWDGLIVVGIKGGYIYGIR